MKNDTFRVVIRPSKYITVSSGRNRAAVSRTPALVLCQPEIGEYR
jgi:hypothetical protein